MAIQGIELTGLDIVPGMISHAKSKAKDLAIEWVIEDARTFNLGRRFKFIFESGATFQHLLERSDQEAMLAHVRDHLTDDGRFVVSSIFPHADVVVDEVNEQQWFTYHTHEGREVRVSGTQHYDALRQIKTETAYRKWHDNQGNEVVKVAPLELRYTYPQEMESLVHHNGFMVVERYGDMDFSPLTAESDHLIYVCTKR